FSVLPAGYRDYDGNFYGVGNYARLWSASDYESTYAYDQHFYFGFANVYQYFNFKYNGFFLRCLQDSN
ncbi:MAG: hypothetical protein HUK21_11270, partial [Fibrobacteraceae bacterium]|nr:hypothetical protein [Fibrobacteraceae bacterium]